LQETNPNFAVEIIVMNEKCLILSMKVVSIRHAHTQNDKRKDWEMKKNLDACEVNEQLELKYT